MQLLKTKIIAEGIHSCIKNAERYFRAAEILSGNREPQTAYLLYLYCLEELGKIPLIWNVLFYMDSKPQWSKWQKRFKDHQEKFWFSKDLDDIAEGKIADKSNVSEIHKAQSKLQVAYVDFDGTRFLLPLEMPQEAIDEILNLCKKRLELIKRRHKSVEEDDKQIQSAYEQFKGLSNEQIAEMAEQRLSDKQGQ